MEGLVDSVLVRQKKMEDALENIQSKISNLAPLSKVEKSQWSDENDRKRLKERLKEVMLASNAASNHIADLIKVHVRGHRIDMFHHCRVCGSISGSSANYDRAASELHS